MSVQNQTVKNVYAGNGSTTVFPFTFALLETDGEYVKVYVTNDAGTSEETENFLIDTQAKTVTYPKAGDPLPEGKKIVIRRELPNEQELNLENLGPFFAEDVEGEFDRVVMMIQQIFETNSRAITTDMASDETPTELLQNIFAAEVNSKNSADAAAESASDAEDSASDAHDSELAADESARDAEAALEEAKEIAKVVGVAGEPYDPTKTYNLPDIVVLPDGSTWRCIQTSTGEYPATSSKWVALALAQSDTFEYDDDGNLQPREYAQSSSMWQIDDDGNIMPQEVISA